MVVAVVDQRQVVEMVVGMAPRLKNNSSGCGVICDGGGWLLVVAVKVSKLGLWSDGVVIFLKYKDVVVVYEMLQHWGSSLVKSEV